MVESNVVESKNRRESIQEGAHMAESELVEADVVDNKLAKSKLEKMKTPERAHP